MGGLTGSSIICLATDYTDRSLRCESAEAFWAVSLPRTLVAPSPRRLSEPQGSRTLESQISTNFIKPPESAEATLYAPRASADSHLAPSPGTQLGFLFTILAERFTMHSSSISSNGQCVAQSPTRTS